MAGPWPYPMPSGFNPAGPDRNPGVTNPLPYPTNMPVACWFGPSVPVVWRDISATDATVQLQAQWSTPIFDMRPDMRNITPNAIATSAGKVSGVPMWNPGAKLWVQLENPSDPDGLRGIALSGFQVLSTEAAHISDPQNLRTISDPEDITASFTTLGQSAILGWHPVGDGQPARYYRLTITFNILKAFSVPEPTPATAPRMTIVPAMY